MNRSITAALAACAMAIGGLVAPQQAQAEEADEGSYIEEIVVTARFREETVQDIGTSMSALAGQLESEGILDFEDLARRTAGLNLFDRGPNQNEVSIRGISNNTALFFADNGQAGPLVSQFLDDIPIAASLGSQRDLNFFDYERVEILRGPQPTLFGEGSVGGTIRYFTRNPDLSEEGMSDTVIKAGLSSTADGGTNYSISAASSAVLSPNVLGLRVVINQRDDGGFIDNPILDDSNFNTYESTSGRVVALFTPNGQVTARFSAHISRDDAGATNLVNPPSAASAADDLELAAVVGGGGEDDFDLYSLKLDYDFDSFTLTSITGWFERDRGVSQVNAPSLAVFCPFILGAGSSCSPTGFSNSEDESFTQELRLVSNFEGPVNFIAGAYYQDSELGTFIGADAPEFANPAFTNPVTSSIFLSDTNYQSEQYSVFAEATFSVSDALRLIAGVRYVDETIDSTAITATNLNPFPALIMGLPPLPMPTSDGIALTQLFGFAVSEEFELKEWLPRVSIEVDVSDGVLLYASFSEGVRNGNLNAPSSVAIASGFNPVGFAELRTHDQDSAESFEVGAKAVWNDGKFITNAAVYKTTYKDPQVQTSVPFVLAINGPDVDIVGLELETIWNVNSYLSAYANLGYQDAEFDGNILLIPAAAALGFPYDLVKGNTPANAPKWSLSAGVDLNVPVNDSGLNLVGYLGYQFVDSSFSTPQNFPSTELDDQSYAHLRLGVESKKWLLVAYASNLTNELAYQHIEYTAAPFVNAQGKLDNAVIGGSVNRPRTIGLEFTLRL
ncbi:MAG: TonB-dependent receptor [Gammaproteobacteria bacterium]|nr:TonB-dependent receptor [Gammaproteobacteria bacterium]